MAISKDIKFDFVGGRWMTNDNGSDFDHHKGIVETIYGYGKEIRAGDADAQDIIDRFSAFGFNLTFTGGVTDVVVLPPPENQATGIITSLGTSVTGTGTFFDTELIIGDLITGDVNGEQHAIAGIATPTALTLVTIPTLAFAGETFTFDAAPAPAPPGGPITFTGFIDRNTAHVPMAQVSGPNPHIETGAIRVGTATSGGVPYEGYEWGANGGSAVLWNQTNGQWECWGNTGFASQEEAGNAMPGLFSHVIATGSVVTDNGNFGPDPALAVVGSFAYLV